MAGVIERARRDLADHQLWRARRRLEGFVGSQGYHRDVMELLGDVCDQMGDLPAAGRFWFFCETRDDDQRRAIEQFVRDAGGDPLVIFSQLPRRLRDTRLERFPPDVQKRLRALLASQPKPLPINIHHPRRAGRAPRDFTVDLFAYSALTLIGLFCLYVFSVGLAHVLAWR